MIFKNESHQRKHIVCPSAARRPVLLAMSLLLVATCVGCSPWQLARRTLFSELNEFPRVTEGRLAYRQYTKWARAEWKSYAAENPGNHSSDYVSGFIQGFTSFVDAGGTTAPPPVPPRRYWRIGYRNPNGDAAVQDWYNGYAHGARVAKEHGYRDRATIPAAAVNKSQGAFSSEAAIDSPTNLYAPSNSQQPMPVEQTFAPNNYEPIPGSVIDPNGTTTIPAEPNSPIDSLPEDLPADDVSGEELPDATPNVDTLPEQNFLGDDLPDESTPNGNGLQDEFSPDDTLPGEEDTLPGEELTPEDESDFLDEPFSTGVGQASYVEVEPTVADHDQFGDDRPPVPPWLKKQQNPVRKSSVPPSDDSIFEKTPTVNDATGWKSDDEQKTLPFKTYSSEVEIDSPADSVSFEKSKPSKDASLSTTGDMKTKDEKREIADKGMKTQRVTDDKPSTINESSQWQPK